MACALSVAARARSSPSRPAPQPTRARAPATTNWLNSSFVPSCTLFSPSRSAVVRSVARGRLTRQSGDAPHRCSCRIDALSVDAQLRALLPDAPLEASALLQVHCMHIAEPCFSIFSVCVCVHVNETRPHSAPADPPTVQLSLDAHTEHLLEGKTYRATCTASAYPHDNLSWQYVPPLPPPPLRSHLQGLHCPRLRVHWEPAECRSLQHANTSTMFSSVCSPLIARAQARGTWIVSNEKESERAERSDEWRASRTCNSESDADFVLFRSVPFRSEAHVPVASVVRADGIATRTCWRRVTTWASPTAASSQRTARGTRTRSSAASTGTGMSTARTEHCVSCVRSLLPAELLCALYRVNQ